MGRGCINDESLAIERVVYPVAHDWWDSAGQRAAAGGDEGGVGARLEGGTGTGHRGEVELVRSGVRARPNILKL